MRITDPLYGSFNITEPVLLDVLQSAALQRLRTVLQHGITGLIAIDPPVLLNGSTHPLSALDPAFAHHRAEYLRRKSGKWPMRVIAAGDE